MLAYGALLDDLRGVAWPARRAARGSAAGVHAARLTGASPEFTEYRPYRQGEDPRRLDWKLLARTDRAYLRITSDRAVVGTMLLVDASASMAYPEPAHDKWAQACRVTVGLAAVAHAAGDPVGVAAAAAGGSPLLPPRTRRGVVADVIHLLADVRPAGGAPLAPLLDRSHRVPRIAVVSDFLGDVEALLRGAGLAVGRGGDVHAIHVVAREELEPTDRPVLAVDPEHPSVSRALAGETREAYRATFAAWREELASRWRAAGAAYHLVTAGESAAGAVRRVVSPGVAALVAR